MLDITYLEEDHHFTHDITQEPGLCDRLEDGRRRAENKHHSISHGQVDDEQVGHGLHVLGPQHDEADKEVANHADGKQNQMQADEEPL